LFSRRTATTNELYYNIFKNQCVTLKCLHAHTPKAVTVHGELTSNLQNNGILILGFHYNLNEVS